MEVRPQAEVAADDLAAAVDGAAGGAPPWADPELGEEPEEPAPGGTLFGVPPVYVGVGPIGGEADPANPLGGMAALHAFAEGRQPPGPISETAARMDAAAAARRLGAEGARPQAAGALPPLGAEVHVMNEEELSPIALSAKRRCGRSWLPCRLWAIATPGGQCDSGSGARSCRRVARCRRKC